MTTRVSFWSIDNNGVNTEDGSNATKENNGPGRGGRGPDARGRAVLLSNPRLGSEKRADHELGRRCLRIAAQPGAARLADELAAEGLVEFIDNPSHRRSKLVRLTRKGEARYRELSARFLTIASTIGAGLSEVDIRKATGIVRQLSEEAKGAAG
jgi:hypothetical protein